MKSQIEVESKLRIKIIQISYFEGDTMTMIGDMHDNNNILLGPVYDNDWLFKIFFFQKHKLYNSNYSFNRTRLVFFIIDKLLFFIVILSFVKLMKLEL